MKIKLLVNNHQTLEVDAENYDELTYLVSMRTKANKEIKTDIALCDYRLVDKETCITVVSADSKTELIEKYKAKYQEYLRFRETKLYQDMKEKKQSE